MLTLAEIDDLKIGTKVDYNLAKDSIFKGKEKDGRHILLENKWGGTARIYTTLFAKYGSITKDSEKKVNDASKNDNNLKFRLQFFPCLGPQRLKRKSYKAYFETKEKADEALKCICDYSLYLDESGYIRISANMGFVDKYVDGEWTEIEDEH